MPSPFIPSYEKRRIEAERLVYDHIIGKSTFSAGLTSQVEDYDLTDHLEFYLEDGTMIAVRVEVILP